MITETKKNTLPKYLCMIFLIAGFIYSIVLSFSWGNNPFNADGTLSLLCESKSRQIFFWLWIFLDGGALFLNINYMYNKYGGANKFIRTLPVFAVISAIAIAATLGHSIADWNPKRIAHWAATICYIIFLVASVVLYALCNFKKGKIFKVIFFFVVALLIVLVLWFIVLGKSGMFEMIPRAFLEIFLLIINFVVKAKE